ncbi:NDR1/HIN1-like protein 13 [Coffea arabica]|uniref:NDR1/HIN1-like protein 13 n=1 Tax=Coffea arabica TaxID=13443 RepID=A0A6P6VLR4_COFAR
MTQAPPLAKPPGYREPGLPVQKPPEPLGKGNLPPSFYTEEEKRRGCCCRCCCCLFIFIILLTLFFISFGGFLYLWYEPRAPLFSLKSFQVNEFNITSTADGPTLHSKMSASLEFKNANKNIKMVYDRIALSWYSDDIASGELGQDTVPGFVQEPNNVRVAKFSMKGNLPLDGSSVKKVTDRIRAKSLMTHVEVRTGIGMVLSGLKIGTVEVKLACEASSLKHIQEGAMPKCKAFVFRL